MSESVRALALKACEKTAPLSRIYEFVQKVRPETADETIRARLHYAVEAGECVRVAKGVYFARSGEAQLLMVEGDAWDMLKKLDSDSVDALITDPPFDMGVKQWVGKGTTRPHAFMGGNRTYEQKRDIDREWLQEAFRVINKTHEWNTLNEAKRNAGNLPKGGGACAIMVPAINRDTWPHIRALIDLAESIGFVFYGTFTWDKEYIGMGYQCGRDRKMEILFFTAGERNGLLWDFSVANVITAKRLRRKCTPDAIEHEAEKPTEIFVQLVKAFTKAGDIILDPFAGRARWVKEVLSMGRHVILGDNGKWLDRIASQDFQVQV